MNLKEQISLIPLNCIGGTYYVDVDKVYKAIDFWIAKKVAEMEKMKHQQCLKNSCVHNDAISACQKVVKEKNG